MFRAIAAAAVVFGLAAFALRHSRIAGSLEEPVLLLLMGTLFLIAGRFFSKMPATWLSDSVPTPS